jgi:putative ABC transport system permease protein
VPGHDADAWWLLQYDASLPSFDGREWGHHLDMVGRLRDGVDAETARAELDRIAAAPIAEVTRPPWASLAQGLSVTGLREAATVGARPTLLALLGAAVLLLGIACVNVTNLLLARGARRRGELAMRAALGATRRRVVRQLLTESLVLAILGGALGLVVAWLGIDALLALSPPGLPRLDAIRLDGSALGFALAVTTLVGVVAGLGPAVGPLRGQVHRDVRESSQRSVGSHLPARRALVVAEVALALVLLVGAGLLVRSLQRLFAVSPGFDPAHVVVMNVQTSSGRFADDAATHVFFDQALEAVRRVPGVVEAAWTSQLPLSGQSDGYGMSLEGSGPSEVLAGGFRYVVSPGYFRAMGIPLLEGRTLDERDEAGAPSAVVVAETFARAAFGDRDPIGERVHVGSQDGPWYTIVGVAGDVTQVSLGDERGSAFYVVPEQWYFADRARWLVVRGGSSGADLVPSIKRAVWSVDPDQAIVRASTMESLVASSEAQRRFAMTVLEAFAIVALVLAGVGLYGALAGSVAERTREIGVRAALGASSGRIVRLVVRQGMTLVGMGAALGLGVAVVASRALSALLFDVSPLDPLTYAGVVGILTTVAGLACWVPAARAAAVDPVRTLKTE